MTCHFLARLMVFTVLLWNAADAAEPLSKRFAAADADSDKKVSLEELFRRSYIVSNHVPDLPSTKRLLPLAVKLP